MHKDPPTCFDRALNEFYDAWEHAPHAGLVDRVVKLGATTTASMSECQFTSGQGQVENPKE